MAKDSQCAGGGLPNQDVLVVEQLAKRRNCPVVAYGSKRSDAERSRDQILVISRQVDECRHRFRCLELAESFCRTRSARHVPCTQEGNQRSNSLRGSKLTQMSGCQTPVVGVPEGV